MKKLITLILATCLSLAIAVPCMAEGEDITVLVNEEELVFDTKPMLLNDRTMVPMRAIFEKLGCSVEWIEDLQMIIATRNSLLIAMQIDQDKFYSTDVADNTQNTYDLDVAPLIVNDRTLIPLRAVSEALGCKVDWVEETSTVVITQ